MTDAVAVMIKFDDNDNGRMRMMSERVRRLRREGDFHFSGEAKTCSNKSKGCVRPCLSDPQAAIVD